MSFVQLIDKKFDLFISEKEILNGIKKVSKKMNEELKGKQPLFICVLNGAFMFASELIGRFEHDCEVTFIRFKSYTGTKRSNNTVNKTYDLEVDITNRNVVVVEDIIDTGYTMDYLLKSLQQKQPLSIRIASLLFKPDALEVSISPDYVVKEIPNNFVVGFGLDYNQRGRNLRDIYQLKTD
ncbi:MAG: hypoxanthine phosphoribosyltransferase [Dysgonamonadaceae bacterium]|jgi:hypoxanthine phosphoribosyltransferase|nr:hypoxanthine phosphoribosyltransferase [Dysgonamonadaceae bacterium]